MKNAKNIFLLLIIALLLGSMFFLIYLIQNGDDPIALLNSRASDANVQDLFGENGLDDGTGSLLSPTPTVVFNSTTPTATPSGTLSITPFTSLTATPSPTLTATKTPTPTVIAQTSISPTIAQLPVAGAREDITKLILGGGSILILLALFL